MLAVQGMSRNGSISSPRKATDTVSHMLDILFSDPKQTKNSKETRHTHLKMIRNGRRVYGSFSNREQIVEPYQCESGINF